MATHYLIDGYNLLHRWRGGRLKPGPHNFEQAREALLRWISRHKGNALATICFDAKRSTAPGLADFRQEGIRVVFPLDFDSADDWIIEQIRAQAGDANLTVVTSDRAIQQAAKRSRITLLDSGDFIARLSEVEEGRNLKPAEDSPRKEVAPEMLKLTDEERDAFRASMQDQNEPAPAPSPARKPLTPPVPPPAEKPRGAGEDLSDFYRQMRSFEDDFKSD